MDELARIAGVSKTTVHRALNGTGRIREETRQRILALAEQTGYRPNRLARGLRRSRTGLVGVVVPGIHGPFYARVLEGLERELQEFDHRALLTQSVGSIEREHELVESLLDTRVDGLIIASEETSPDYYLRLLERGTPIVFFDRAVPGLSADLVSTDHFLGGAMLAEHLAELGYRSPVFLSFSNTPTRTGSVEDRWCGFRSVFRNAAILDYPFMESAKSYLRDHPELETPDSFSLVCRYAVAGAMEPITDFPYDCVFAQYDHFALAVIDALRASGRRVPEDVAVVGFDNQDLCEYADPALTTVSQPLVEVGALAARRLMARLDEPSLPAEALRLPPRLIVRRSSGATIKTTQL